MPRRQLFSFSPLSSFSSAVERHREKRIGSGRWNGPSTDEEFNKTDGERPRGRPRISHFAMCQGRGRLAGSLCLVRSIATDEIAPLDGEIRKKNRKKEVEDKGLGTEREPHSERMRWQGSGIRNGVRANKESRGTT